MRIHIFQRYDNSSIHILLHCSCEIQCRQKYCPPASAGLTREKNRATKISNRSGNLSDLWKVVLRGRQISCEVIQIQIFKDVQILVCFAGGVKLNAGSCCVNSTSFLTWRCGRGSLGGQIWCSEVGYMDWCLPGMGTPGNLVACCCCSGFPVKGGDACHHDIF